MPARLTDAQAITFLEHLNRQLLSYDFTGTPAEMAILYRLSKGI